MASPVQHLWTYHDQNRCLPRIGVNFVKDNVVCFFCELRTYDNILSIPCVAAFNCICKFEHRNGFNPPGQQLALNEDQTGEVSDRKLLTTNLQA